MKYVTAFPGLLVLTAIVLKMYVLNCAAADGHNGYSYMCFNWPFNKTAPDKILQFWEINIKSKAAVEKLLFVDCLFIPVYTVLLCNWSYNLLQKQNRLWLNIWLRMGICCVLLVALLNLVQDYFIYLSLDSAQIYPFMNAVFFTKWFFVLLVAIPIIVSFFNPPIQTFGSQNISKDE